MKNRFIALLSILLSLPLFASDMTHSPCFQSGSYVQCYPAGGINIDSMKTLRFGSNNSNYVEIGAQAGTTTYTMLWPAVAGILGQAMQLDGSGNFTWYTPSTTAQTLNYIIGVSAKTMADAASTANVTPLSGVATVDGVLDPQKVLLKNQTDPTENGLWLTNDFGAWSRSYDMPAVNNGFGSLVTVAYGGTTNSETVWFGVDDGVGNLTFKQIPINTSAAQKVIGFNSLSPMTTAGDVIYGGASGTGTRLAPGTSVQVLHSGTTPTWSALSLTADVTGTLAIGSGGTGQTTKAPAFDALQPMTTAGDVIYGGASGTGTRLAKGTSVQVLHSGTTPTWSALSLTADVTGTLPVGNGGTGLASGTSGGIPYFSSTSAMTSSGLLTASAVVLGGGAGATPTSLALGTANQVLGMTNAATAHEYKTVTTGTSGSDFAVAHSANTITLNLPDAGASARGAVTTGTQTMAGLKTFSGGVQFTTTGGTPSTLDFYEDGTFVASLTGPRSISLTMRFTRNGKLVCMTWDRQIGTSCSNSHFDAAAAIPSRLRPGNGILQPLGVQDNAATPTTPGCIQIGTNGTIDIFKDIPGNNYTNGAACGFFEGSVCYSTN